MQSVTELSPNTLETLKQAAIDAADHAYAPYSNYHVGAALITEDGTIYKGCNIENASYGLVNCAERTAVFTARCDSTSKIKAMVVAHKAGGMPCGACRQVLNEFNPQMLIYGVNFDGEVCHKMTLAELLPNAFGPESLELK